MIATSRAGTALVRTLALAGEWLGLLVQLLLIALGASIVLGEDRVETELLLVIWCLVASAYLGSVILWLNVQARRADAETVDLRVLVAHPIARLVAIVTAFLSSVIGLSVAIDLIISLGRDERNLLVEFCGVWAMLLSWAMFNWGYSRIYYSRYHRAARSGEAPLEFRSTPAPALVDFVYFAFTNATAFSVSDVVVTTTRMRWTVVWHTTLAFFFNALIIVLSMNIIASGSLVEQLFQ